MAGIDHGVGTLDGVGIIGDMVDFMILSGLITVTDFMVLAMEDFMVADSMVMDIMETITTGIKYPTIQEEVVAQTTMLIEIQQ